MGSIHGSLLVVEMEVEAEVSLHWLSEAVWVLQSLLLGVQTLTSGGISPPRNRWKRRLEEAYSDDIRDIAPVDLTLVRRRVVGWLVPNNGVRWLWLGRGVTASATATVAKSMASSIGTVFRFWGMDGW